MGRSFDRGGQSRKELMRGKRRAYQQAERDREARDAVAQARRTGVTAGASRRLYSEPAVVAPDIQTTRPSAITAIIDHKRPGFFTRVMKRMFGKAA